MAVMTACATTGTPGETTGNTEGPRYPTNNIEILVAFEGGTTDTVARMVAKYASSEWGVNVDVVNRPGSNTVPANLQLQGAEPDGYTLMMQAVGSTSILPNQLGSDLPFDVMNQTFIAMVSSNTQLFIVSPDSPLNSLKDAAEKAKADPEHFTWSASGVADIPMRQFLRDIGVDVNKTKSVIQDGTSDAIVLASQGDADLVMAAPGLCLGPIADGIIKPLAVAFGEPWPGLDLPTAIQEGFPSVEVNSWLGLAGPAGLSDEVVTAWEGLIQKMLADPEIQQQIKNVAAIPYFKDSKDFTAQVQEEINEFKSLYE
jgi:tripartite-type tricarboxylate transporter receptor subunit TctC